MIRVSPRAQQIVLFSATVLGFILLSPKWLFPVAAWIAPGLLLYFLDNKRSWRVFMWSFMALFLAGLVANYKVFPFPLPLLAPLTFQTALIASLPYGLSILVTRRVRGATASLVFPSLAVLQEYLSSFSGGGTWGSIGYSQTYNSDLLQLASITGIWGVSFLIYWFGAVMALTLRYWRQERVRFNAGRTFGLVMVAVILFGEVRTNRFIRKPVETVKVAGITAWNLEPLLVIYEIVYGKHLEVRPEELTQTSPALQELNKALALFIEDPLNSKHAMSHAALEAFQDSMFRIAEKEVYAGAKLIVFSEALMLTIKPHEEKLMEKGKTFARRHGVRVVLGVASFLPGKVEFGSRYVENKAIVIGEDGVVESVFFKNKPVPMVEGSVVGDGEIPVIQTRFGKLAVSICYDADFPGLIRQASLEQADILVLPSGDWKEVSPYHADMARVRAVENGFSLLRPASGATSIACNAYGEILSIRDFYDNGEKVITAHLPVQRIVTVYSLTGDVLPWACLAFLFFYLPISLRSSKSSGAIYQPLIF
jgi:apolipoprotein N-acyltransferase